MLSRKRTISKPAKKIPGAQSLKAKWRRAPVRKVMQKPRSAPLLLSPREEDLERDTEKVIVRLHKSLLRALHGYRQEQRQIIASGCAVAAFLESHEEAWSDFCDHQVWKERTLKPHPQKSDQALRFVLLRISGLSKGGAKRASKWHKAIQPLVESGVEPKDMPAAIKREGGIEALARRNAKARKSKSTRGAPAKKLLTAPKKTEGEAIKHGPTAKSSTFVDLRAKLVEEGEEFFSLPKGAHANLSIVMQGSKGSKFDISILDVKRIKPPVV